MSELIDVICFIGNTIGFVFDVLTALDFFFSVGRFFKSCAAEISAAFGKSTSDGHRPPLQ